MRKIRHSFNMVEIVLAIGVVAFGITGVMALLPPALNAMKNVNYDTFMDEAASMVQWLIDQELKNHASAIPNYAKPSDDEVFPVTKTAKLGDTNIYKIKNYELYYIESTDGELGVHVKLWKEQINDLYGLKETHDTANNAYRVYICINWERNAKWSARKKRYIVYDVFPEN